MLQLHPEETQDKMLMFNAYVQIVKSTYIPGNPVRKETQGLSGFFTSRS